MKFLPSPLTLASVLAAAVLVTAPRAQAQEQPGSPPVGLSQRELESFADAAVEVQRLETELNTDLEAADSPGEAARLRQKAEGEATRAVQANGLTTGEYMAIVRAAEQDPALYAMITDMMRQRAQ
jgi:Domain of unknown function (DUF4168)